MYYLFFVYLSILHHFISCSSIISTPQFSMSFSREVSMKWKVDYTDGLTNPMDNATITFTIEWIEDTYGSIGFNTVMDKNDMIIFSYDDVPQISDRYGNKHDTPPLDTSKGGTMDTILIGGSKINGKKQITFWRKANTGDSRDFVITNKFTKMMWAIGPGAEPNPKLHTWYGVHPGVNFFTGEVINPFPWQYIILAICVILTIIVPLLLRLNWRYYLRLGSIGKSQDSIDSSSALVNYCCVPIKETFVVDLIIFVIWLTCLILWMIFYGIQTVGASVFGSALGRGAQLLLFIQLFPILRNTLLKYGYFVSFERSTRFHRYMGTVIFILSSIHGVAMLGKYSNICFKWNDKTDANPLAGVLSWIFMLLIGVFSFSIIRRKFWDMFYYSHRVFFILIIVFGIIHQIDLLWGILPSLFLYAVDLFIRAFQFFTQKASILKNDEFDNLSLITINLPNFKFEPGQYVFICIPEISLFQWHPFTIASSPASSNEGILLAIQRTQNGYTSLMNAVHENSTIYLEGPYGCPSVPINYSPTVVLIAGGVGVTPIISLLSYYISNYRME